MFSSSRETIPKPRKLPVDNVTTSNLLVMEGTLGVYHRGESIATQAIEWYNK